MSSILAASAQHSLAMFGPVSILLASALLYIAKLSWDHLTNPLGAFEGPQLAKFTNWWRLIDLYRGRCDVTQLKLHEKYGGAVRLGPNTISLSDPNMIKVVYNVRLPWKKVFDISP